MLTFARNAVNFVLDVTQEVFRKLLMLAFGSAFIILGIILTIILAVTR